MGPAPGAGGGQPCPSHRCVPGRRPCPPPSPSPEMRTGEGASGSRARGRRRRGRLAPPHAAHAVPRPCGRGGRPPPSGPRAHAAPAWTRPQQDAGAAGRCHASRSACPLSPAVTLQGPEGPGPDASQGAAPAPPPHVAGTVVGPSVASGRRLSSPLWGLRRGLRQLLGAVAKTPKRSGPRQLPSGLLLAAGDSARPSWALVWRRSQGWLRHRPLPGGPSSPGGPVGTRTCRLGRVTEAARRTGARISRAPRRAETGQGLPAASGPEGARRAPPLAPSSMRGAGMGPGASHCGYVLEAGLGLSSGVCSPLLQPFPLRSVSGGQRNPKFREGAGFTRVLGLALAVGTALDAGLGQKRVRVGGGRRQVPPLAHSST